MSNYKPYPKYKESGVAWLGEVPEGWEVKRLGQYFNDRREKVSDKDFKALSVTKRGIVPQLDNAAKTNDGDNRKKVCKGDYVINSRSDRKGSSGLSSLDGSVSLINIILEPRNIDGYFVHYLLRSYPFQEEFYRYGKGIVADLWSTNYSEMKNINIPIPSLQEQAKIANYLDQKTKKIDTLIEKQQTLIELLKEKRQALISHVVRKGLDDSVPMKESGVAWLGEVPEGWEVSKLKFMFKFSKGLTITKANLVDEGIPCVNYGEIHSKYGFEVSLDKHKLKCVKNSYLIDSKSSLLSKGDFVFADTSEDLEGAGNFTHVSSQGQIFAGYHTIIARQVNNHNFRFLVYLMDSENFRTQIRLSVKGVKVFSITQALLKDCNIWLPSKQEQTQIANYLDEKTKKIDTLIEKSKHSIELLKERRTALISAVVTGKVDVRDS